MQFGPSAASRKQIEKRITKEKSPILLQVKNEMAALVENHKYSLTISRCLTTTPNFIRCFPMVW